MITFAPACGARENAAPTQATARYTTPVVLLVSPDSLEVDSLRAQLGDDFYVAADDAIWYRALASDLLDSLAIPRTEVRRGQAEFMVHQKVKLVSWKATPFSWFAVVYDGANEPIIVPDIDLRDVVVGMANERN